MPKLTENKVFQDADAARRWLESRLWPHGPVCGHCGAVEASRALPPRPGQKSGRGVYQCNACRKQFTVTVGTVFERSHIPLNKWLLATFLFVSSKKGVSAHQMHRLLGITYKSAWFMMHRLREAMAPGSDGPLGGAGKIVEADETYLLKQSGKRKHPSAGGYAHKMKVLALTERGGRIRSTRMIDGTKAEIVANLRQQVHPDSILHTDGAQAYKFTGAVAAHESVDHSKAYVRKGKSGDKVHTNTLEGYFSVFKRGMVGIYQHVGEQHLHRYLAEFDFRQNTRAKLGVDDEMRAERAIAGIVGKRLTYRRIGPSANA